jgi:rubrerythrin
MENPIREWNLSERIKKKVAAWKEEAERNERAADAGVDSEARANFDRYAAVLRRHANELEEVLDAWESLC